MKKYWEIGDIVYIKCKSSDANGIYIATQKMILGGLIHDIELMRFVKNNHVRWDLFYTISECDPEVVIPICI